MPFGLRELFDVLVQPTLWILLPILFVQFLGEHFKRVPEGNPQRSPVARDRNTQ